MYDRLCERVDYSLEVLIKKSYTIANTKNPILKRVNSFVVHLAPIIFRQIGMRNRFILFANDFTGRPVTNGIDNNLFLRRSIGQLLFHRL